MNTLPHLPIAVIQFAPQYGQNDQNRLQAQQLIEQAATQGAKLVVLPECCISGYAFPSKDELTQLAEPPSGPTEQNWLQLAQTHDIAIAGGIAIQEGDQLYNSLLFVTPEGTSTRYNKTHLFDWEQRWFTPGDTLCTIEWNGLHIGFMICYDGWFPEVPRALTLVGADLILAPGCWIKRPDIHTDTNAAQALHLAAAYSNSVFIACASRWGRENNAEYAGKSCIIGPNGMVAGPASDSEDAILHATIDLREARFKYRTKRLHPIKNRRPQLYQSITKPTP